MICWNSVKTLVIVRSSSLFHLRCISFPNYFCLNKISLALFLLSHLCKENKHQTNPTTRQYKILGQIDDIMYKRRQKAVHNPHRFIEKEATIKILPRMIHTPNDFCCYFFFLFLSIFFLFSHIVFESCIPIL